MIVAGTVPVPTKDIEATVCHLDQRPLLIDPADGTTLTAGMAGETFPSAGDNV